MGLFLHKPPASCWLPGLVKKQVPGLGAVHGTSEVGWLSTCLTFLEGPLGKIAGICVSVLAFKKLLGQVVARFHIYTSLI